MVAAGDEAAASEAVPALEVAALTQVLLFCIHRLAK